MLPSTLGGAPATKTSTTWTDWIGSGTPSSALGRTRVSWLRIVGADASRVQVAQATASAAGETIVAAAFKVPGISAAASTEALKEALSGENLPVVLRTLGGKPVIYTTDDTGTGIGIYDYVSGDTVFEIASGTNSTTTVTAVLEQVP